ncbi:MAG: hypothetical protein ABR525_06560 [Candidatus Limnocylindria bacterium]
MVGSLMSLAIWVPAVTAVATVAIRLSAHEGWLRQYAPVLGLLIGLFVWVLASRVMRGLAAVDLANGNSHAELSQRSLDARTALTSLSQAAAADDAARSARREAETELAELERILGIGSAAGSGALDARWAAGWGYVDAWRRMNRIEESLILIQPEPLAVAGAFEDRARLGGSGMQGAEELSAALRLGVRTLSPNADPYFATTLQAAVRDAPADKTQARAILARVRHAINEYRNDRWDGIVRARNQIAQSTLFTGFTAYALLVVALLRDAGDEVVAGASVYYLVGGIVGLFSRLRSDAEANSAVEDYGLAKVRLIATPLISGLAAVSGVVLIALLAGSALGTFLAPPTSASQVLVPTISAGASPAPSAAPAAPGAISPSPLGDIFDVARYPIGLLIAAVFGLTPGLLVSQLQQQADRYKQDLQRSEPADGRAKR